MWPKLLCNDSLSFCPARPTKTDATKFTSFFLTHSVFVSWQKLKLMGPQYAFEILRNIDCFALIISYISIMTWHILFNVRIDQFANPDLCPSNHQRGQGVHDKEIYQRQVSSKTVFWINSSCVSCFGAIDGTQDDQSQIRWDRIEILWRERWSTILHSR